MKRTLSILALGVGFLTSGNLGAALAQETVCPDYYGCGPDRLWTNGGTQGYSTNEFDLDFDGRTDFRLIQRTAGGTRGEENPYIICSWYDETHALFADPHVQMYLSKTIEDCLYIPPEARLTLGQPIPARPDSNSTWEWVQPTNVARLKGIGFGWTGRILSYGAPSIEGPIYLEPGYMKVGPVHLCTNVLFGFRLQKADEWHLGWLRLVLSYTPKGAMVFQITESSVNPIPGQDVVAGVRAGTILGISAIGTNGVNLTWSTNATNAVLEQKLKLSDPAWVAVLGITNNQYTVTPTNPSSFYRLRTAP
jgi:hypothetical protein